MTTLEARQIPLFSAEDEAFLNSLPELERFCVQTYAAIEGISYREASEELLAAEIEENKADRGR